MASAPDNPATAPSPKAESPKAPGSPAPQPASPPKSPAQPPATSNGTAENPPILPLETWAQPVEDEEGNNDEFDDADSALGEDSASSTASLTASILEYRTLHGRTYHSNRGNAQYWGSNDERAAEAMDINHHMLTLATGGKLFMAPLEQGKVKKALDVGTGTGVWAIDFADMFPSTEVIGTDLSPIQPTWVPPNLTFEIDDATEPWTYAPNSFDYIHMRYLLGSVADWDALYGEVYKALRPGGWFEHYESSPYIESDDGTITDKTALGQWGHIFVEGGKKMGRTFTVVPDGLQKSGMEKAGFVDVQTWDFKCPLGGWPRDPKLKEIGLYARMALESDIEGYVLFITNVISGWTREQVLVYIAHLRREMRNHAMHGYFRLRIVWGRKPEN